MAGGRRDSRDGLFVRVGDRGGGPPGEGAGLVALRGEGEGFADFEAEGGWGTFRDRFGVAVGVMEAGVLPPLQDLDVPPRAGLLEGGFRVAERQAGMAPPVEDGDEAGLAGAVEGVGVVFFRQEGGRGAPPFEDGDFAEDGGGLGREQGVAEAGPEEVLVLSFEVREEVGAGEFDDELDAEAGEPFRGWVGGELVHDVRVRAAEDSPFESSHPHLGVVFDEGSFPFGGGR